MASDNQAQINSCNKEISSLTSQIRALEAKIERLAIAEKEVNTAYIENESFISSIKNYVPNLWEGSNRNTFGENKTDAENLANTYHSNLLETYWTIHRKRKELEAEKFWNNASLALQQFSLNNLSSQQQGMGI